MDIGLIVALIGGALILALIIYLSIKSAQGLNEDKPTYRSGNLRKELKRLKGLIKA